MTDEVVISRAEWVEMNEELARLQKFHAVVDDLLGHHIGEPWHKIVIEPGPKMTYDIHLRIDGMYEALGIAEAVALDIWGPRYDKLVTELEATRNGNRHR